MTEKYVESVKHIGMHIVGEHHGHILCLMQADCSVRRRNESITEETPCSWLSNELRYSIKATAARITELLDFERIGAVEFVVDTKTGHFFFLKVNARLQVEHPIIEEVTGYDLVALRILISFGANLDDTPVTTAGLTRADILSHVNSVLKTQSKLSNDTSVS